MNAQDSAKAHTGSRPAGTAGTSIFQFAAVALLGTSVLHAGPQWGTLATASLWFVFSIYWSFAV